MYETEQDQPIAERAPGTVVAGSIIFGGGYGILAAGTALSGAAYSGNPLVAALGIVGLVAAVVIAWYLWRGRSWALSAAIVLAVGALLAIFVVMAIGGDEPVTPTALGCPLALLVLTVGLLVVPQTSRRWFWG